MKINTILLIPIFMFTVACVPSIRNYEGYIYNIQKEPVEGLKICEQRSENCSFTNSKGYFKLKKNVSSIRSLIIYNNDMPIDTIKTVWSQHGEKLNYSFIEGKNDTLFIDVK